VLALIGLVAIATFTASLKRIETDYHKGGDCDSAAEEDHDDDDDDDGVEELLDREVARRKVVLVGEHLYEAKAGDVEEGGGAPPAAGENAPGGAAYAGFSGGIDPMGDEEPDNMAP
jgi:hypothetical protein